MYRPPHPSLRSLAPAFALAALLAGCGGATEKVPSAQPPAPQPPAPQPPSPPPLPPSPPGMVSLRFSSDNNVFEQGSSSNTIQVRATKDGSNADDVTVLFSTTYGSVSPASVQPRAGLAATNLALPGSAATGAITVTASASATNTATESWTAYVRPAPEKLQVLVPAYFSDEKIWTALTTAAQSYPDVQINVIVKPDNANTGVIAPGTYTPDSKLVTAVTALKTAHPNTKVLAYVATGGGAAGVLSLTDVKTTIDQYVTGYGNKIDGFFLDGMATQSNLIAPFYSPLAAHIGSRTGLGSTPPLVFGNPATYPAKDYADLVKVLVTYNGSATNYLALDPQTAGAPWVYERANSAQAALVHSAATCATMQAAVARAHLPRMNTGWLFVTDQTVGAPWSALPANIYWKSFLGTVDATNKGYPLPSC